MATAAWYRKRVGTVLNVMGTSAGAVAVPTSTDDPAYPDEEIDEKVIMAANAVIGLVASIPNHPFIRALISESSNIAHGGQLPAHIGPIYAVRVSINGTTAFNPAIPDAPDAVQRRIDDATSGSTTPGRRQRSTPSRSRRSRSRPMSPTPSRTASSRSRSPSSCPLKA
jgi:hypothetical protein